MNLYVLPSLFAVIVLCALSVFVFLRRPPAPMWPALQLNFLLSLLFSIGDVLTQVVQDPQYNWWAITLVYTGVIFLPLAWWMLAIRFAQAYAHGFSLDARVWIAAPAGLAMMLWVAMLTNPWHGQFLTQVVGSRSEYHWLWWVHAGLAYSLVLSAVILYVVLASRVKTNRRRTRIWVMVIAAVLNTLGNLAYVLWPEPPPFDPTALGYSLSGVLYLLAIYRVEFFSLSSVAIATVLQQQTNGIVVTHRDGSLHYWNPAAERLLRDPLDAIDVPFCDWLNFRLLKVEPSGEVSAAPFDSEVAFYQALVAPGVKHGAVLFRHAQDSDYWLSIGVITIVAKNGRAIGRSFQVEDHSQRQWDALANEQLRQRADYGQKLESLGLLAGGIAHDFNNLLMVIQGNTEMALQRIANGANPTEMLQAVGAAGNRATRLTKQLLAYAGKAPMETRPLDLSALVRETAQLLHTATLPRSVALNLDVGPEIWIEGDLSQLEQMLMNLTINAVEASDRGGRVVIHTGTILVDRTYLNSCLHPGSAIPGAFGLLAVSDSGDGLLPEEIGTIFDPFFSTKGAGRGLGLSAVLGIVKSHGGALDLQTEVGVGTTMQILIPQKAKPDAQQLEELVLADADVPSTVLVVDDDDAVRGVSAQMLVTEAFTVLQASGGRMAIDLATKHGNAIDLVLLDVTMPDMDGLQTFLELRKLRQNLAVVFVSGHPQEALNEQLQNEGGVQFLMKPFTKAELLQKVHAAQVLLC